MKASTILDATRAWETATGQVDCVFVTYKQIYGQFYPSVVQQLHKIKYSFGKTVEESYVLTCSK